MLGAKFKFSIIQINHLTFNLPDTNVLYIFSMKC